MDAPSFSNLKYGNILQLIGGQKVMVTMTITDASGNTAGIAYAPCFTPSDAPGLTMLNAAYRQTVLEIVDDKEQIVGQTINPSVGQTINPSLGWGRYKEIE